MAADVEVVVVWMGEYVAGSAGKLSCSISVSSSEKGLLVDAGRGVVTATGCGDGES